MELFVDTIPNTLCCDELETWFFKLYFYNFLAEFADCYKQVSEWPSEDREEFLKFLKETGGLDLFFRLPRRFEYELLNKTGKTAGEG